MKNRNAGSIRLVLLVFLAVLLLSGCATEERQVLALRGEPPQAQQAEDLSMSLNFLDEAFLRQRYGERGSNPYITTQSTVTFQRIMVFELRLANGRSESVSLQLNRMELQFGGKNLAPTNRFHLGQYWEIRDERDRVSSSEQWTINRTMLDNRVTLKPGASGSGYVVFMGNLPRNGTATVYVPAIAGKDQEIHTFEFRFEF